MLKLPPESLAPKVPSWALGNKRRGAPPVTPMTLKGSAAPVGNMEAGQDRSEGGLDHSFLPTAGEQ